MPNLLEVKAGGSRQGQLHVAPDGGRYLPDGSERGASSSLLGHKPGEGTGKVVEEATVTEYHNVHSDHLPPSVLPTAYEGVTGLPTHTP